MCNKLSSIDNRGILFPSDRIKITRILLYACTELSDVSIKSPVLFKINTNGSLIFQYVRSAISYVHIYIVILIIHAGRLNLLIYAL